MKLRTKIHLFSSLFMLILIMLINMSIYFLFHNLSTKHELDELVNQSNTIIETINTNPDIPKNELLHALLRGNNMIRIYEQGQTNPILVLTKDNEFQGLPGKFSETESREIITGEENVPVAVISKPIIWDNGEVVTLELSEHLIAVKTTMKTLFYVLLVASLIILIPVIIAARILSRFILQPIQVLTKTMRENTHQGNWQKINIDNRSHDELYEMEKTFNDMIETLKHTFEKQEVFVSDASHELKTPLSIVKSYTQLLQRQGHNHPELLDEATEAIDSESDRMQKLVEQMLFLVKDQPSSSFDTIDLGNMCEKVVMTFQGAYEREVIYQATATDQLVVNGDKDQLRQVIYILLDNALKYSHGEVYLSLQSDNDTAKISVKDYGDGISQQEVDRIFDRFYRVDEARNRKTGGTGLGLAIAKTIVTIHHGEITVDSKKGIGTTFTITLPIVKDN